MSMDDYLAALKLIEDSGEGDFEGNKSDSLIDLAEKALGLKFPPTYKRFLKDLGCGDVGGEEFYGVINDEFNNSSVPNGIWLTLNERNNISLQKKLIVIYATGDGTYYAIDTSRIDNDGECPVVSLSVNGEIIENIAPNFGKFFLDTVSQVI